MSKFIKGTLILLAAGFITRILGFINRIAIARLLGEEGVGLYMMAYPSFILVVTITQLGLPVAISKRVAEAEAKKDSRKVKKILAVSLTTTISLSIIFTPLLMFGAPIIADQIFTDQRTLYPLLAISPIVPIIAVSSVLRGYFQGKQNMKPSAISQVIEQAVRIGFIFYFTHLLYPYGIEYAAAGAMAASIIGELVSLLYLATMFKLKKHFPMRKNFFHALNKSKGIFKELMSIALPTTGSRMVGSISWFLEPIVVTHSLALAGITTVVATKQYGALTGFAMPLLLLPSFITFALSTALVPSISEAYALKNLKLVENRLQQAIKFALISGGLSSVVLYVLAEPLMEFLYHSTNGAIFLKLMAPFFILYYIQGPLQAVLQALDLAKAAMINSIFGNIIKIGCIFMLASHPSFGIIGAALGIVVGMMVTTLLHYATVLKTIPITFFVRQFFKIIGSIIVTGACGIYIFHTIKPMTPLITSITISIVAMVGFYFMILLVLRVINFSEIKRLIMMIHPSMK